MGVGRVVRKGVGVAFHEGRGSGVGHLAGAAEVVLVVQGGDALHGRKVVLAEAVAVLVAVLLLNRAGGEDLDLAREDHLEGLAADGLVDAGKAGAIAPLVELTAERVGLELEKAELARSECAVPAGRVDVGDRRVDDGGLGRTADLGEVGEEGGQILCS